jgi:hypothetical protein
MKYTNGKYTFSATEVEAYLNCPKYFFLNKIKEVPTEWDNTPLHVGTMFHLSRQSFEFCQIIMESIKKKIPIKDYHHLKNLCNISNPEEAELSAYADEMMIQADFGEANIRGKIDRIGVSNNKLVLIDWKTTKSKPKEDVLKHAWQYVIYSVLAAEEFHWKEEIVFKYIYFVKSGSYETQVIPIYFSSEEIQRDKKMLAEIIKDMVLFCHLYKEDDEGQDIAPYPREGGTELCFRCPYRKRCEQERKNE